MALHDWLQRVWYGSASGGWLLRPVSWLFAAAIELRRLMYRTGMLPAGSAGRPVVVVGNLTTGGAGKTPMTLWLAEQLLGRGLRAGIASRGYGRIPDREPLLVHPEDDPGRVGDEPLLMARRRICPVVVCDRRLEAARRLASEGVDVVLCDDGLQHYALRRDVEIAVVDGRRRFGNGRLLPAGPLREPATRLDTVDWRICNGGRPAPGEIGMRLEGSRVTRLDGSRTVAISEFRGKRCHAVAAIGDPDRFFDMLRDAGMEVVRHPLPDHATARLSDLGLPPGEPVIMTEKDAVKCSDGGRFDAWYLPVDARLEEGANEIVDEIVRLCSENVPRRG